ncbi:MAG TPA: M43 family zinc metalloprotease [Flavobacteriales bacterium]|nr:M43 family zinc metalloprotease [Flavobacteriales bacterium]
MLTKQALVLLCALSAFMAGAQERCPSHTITQRWMQAHGTEVDLAHEAARLEQQAPLREGQWTIPVVVHVVWNTTAENVPSSVIHGIIDRINADYQALNADYNNVRPAFLNSRGNAQIGFCLATVDPAGNPTTGIVRKQTTKTWFNPDTETDDMKFGPVGSPAWNTSKYLNIWICDISSGATGGFVTAGYAYLPIGGLVGSAMDGLVLDYSYGTADRTPTHEIGHYFGLPHPWGDGNCDPGDGISDTPATDSPTFNCSNPNLMKCGTLTQYENFMDYTSCTRMFTNGQVNVMHNILTGARASLLTSGGCGSPPVDACIPSSAVGPADGDFIDGVALEGISNLNSGSTGGPSYNNFTFLSTTLHRGASYSLKVTTGEYYEDLVAAWIDYNGDNVFTEPEMIGMAMSSSDFQETTFPFTVPMGAVNGNTTMRVRVVYPGEDDPETPDPCFNFHWGETEDYRIVISGPTGMSEGILPGLVVQSMGDEVWVSWPTPGLRQQVLLLDATGRRIDAWDAAGTGLRINTAHLAAGAYQLVLLQDGTRSTARFVAAR